jgi:four helix bundle protein
MNQPISPARLLSRFVAYRASLEAVHVVTVASARWRGWAHLVDQARRAAVSVTHNLAEGNGHPPGSADRRRFRRIALGSALELEAALDIALVAGLGDAGELAAARTAAGRSAALCTALCRAR